MLLVHSTQHTAHSTLNYLRCKVKSSAFNFFQIIFFSLVLVTLNACKRDMSEKIENNHPTIGIDDNSRQVTNILLKYNFITKSKNTHFKTIEQIDSDSVPIILDILLSYNAVENKQGLENVDIFEYTYDFPVDAEGKSNIITIDSLYEIIYNNLMVLLDETTEQNKFLHFVSVFYDGRFENGLKGIKVLTERASGDVALMPRYVPANQSWRAHSGYNGVFGLDEHFGGQCNDFTKNPNKIGAPDIIQNYANYNLSSIQPTVNIPNGYKLIFIEPESTTVFPANTYDPNHPTFSLYNYQTNAPFPNFFPTKLYACATMSSWVISPNLVQAPCLSSVLMNYYIDKAVELAHDFKPQGKHPFLVTIIDNKGTNCMGWNPMPNTPFNTGKSIDHSVCPNNGWHDATFHYKKPVLVPDNL